MENKKQKNYNTNKLDNLMDNPLKQVDFLVNAVKKLNKVKSSQINMKEEIIKNLVYKIVEENMQGATDDLMDKAMENIDKIEEAKEEILDIFKKLWNV